MRVFCAVRHSVDAHYYSGGLWSASFYSALRQLGHQIVESKVDLLATSRFMHVPSHFTPEELEVRARTTQEILDEVRIAMRSGPIDLFLGYFYNAHFDPAGFEELRRLGIPSVNFFCNSIYQFDLVAEVAASADFSWHPERDAHDSYIRVGANPLWVQMGADPDVYHPFPESSRRPAACFVGQRYADRDRWVAAIVRSGVPVSVFGAGWGDSNHSPAPWTGEQTREYLGRRVYQPGTMASYIRAARLSISQDGLLPGFARVARQARYRSESARLSAFLAPHARGPIPFEKMLEVFGTHEICLNFSNVWADGRPGSALVPHVRLRDFEAPMCRTCYLTGFSDEIGEFYELGKEIDTYRTPEELVDKTRYYLGNAEAAEKLRSAAYKRAVTDHTWTRRFAALFRKAGIGTHL